MLINRVKQQGLTLTELMVGMTVGLVVTGGVLSVYLTTIVSSASTLKSSHLNQELAAIMSVMVNDIRRAGYWGRSGTCFAFMDYIKRPHSDATLLPGGSCTAPAGPPYYNPFNIPGTTALEVHNASGVDQGALGNGPCIVYTYDADDDGTIDGDEHMGFRLNAAGTEVQMRVSGTVVNSCTNGTWEGINEANDIVITSLDFDLDGAASDSQCINAEDGSDCYTTAPTTGNRTTEMRVVTITLAGRLAGDASVTASLTQTVRVRNDLLRQY